MRKPSKVAELENENRRLRAYISELEYRLKLDCQDDDMTSTKIEKAITVTLPDGSIRVIKPR